MRTIFIVLLAAQSVTEVATQGSSPIDGKCKQANDYEKLACGVKDKSLTCCSHKQACIGLIKPHKGDDKYECSKDRKLAGSKVMKIILIPLIFMIMDILFIVVMVVKLDVKRNHVTKLCIGAIAVSWPLLLSSKWFFGVWAGFLSLFVAYMSNNDGLPRWIYRIVWAMQIFQVVLIFGPNEAFHVPLFNQSLAGKNADLLTDILKLKEKDCDTHYENFFKFLAIEKTPTGFNTDLEYFGLCTEEFLGFVQAFLMLQGLLWIVTALLSAKVFLTDAARSADGARSDPVTKVQPASAEKPADAEAPKDAAEEPKPAGDELREAAMVVEPVKDE